MSSSLLKGALILQWAACTAFFFTARALFGPCFCFSLSWFILAIVGIASIPVYVKVARCYKRRERQEIVND